MLRRLGARACVQYACCVRSVCNVSSDTRDLLTKHLTALHEECKGQGLDLSDMGDAVKLVAHGFQECARKTGLDDNKWKAKFVTLSASIKAYQTRLSNLKNESHSIQAEVDTLLRLLWGTERPGSSHFASPLTTQSTLETIAGSVTKPATLPGELASTSPSATTDDFDAEPPLLSRILESPDTGRQSTLSAAPAVAQPIERVEAEKVETTIPPSRTSAADDVTEIEVETLEVDLPEGETADKDCPVEVAKITDLTKELFEKGIDFSDCLDARSLRQRYNEFLSGSLSSAQKESSTASEKPALSSNSATQQPRMPAKPKHDYDHQMSAVPPHEQNRRQEAPTSNDIATDPYPNAERKMLDPMKYVWQVKLDIAQEKGVRAEDIELWSSQTRLDDVKRLYDYPSIQSYPLEVRQRGAYPRH